MAHLPIVTIALVALMVAVWGVLLSLGYLGLRGKLMQVDPRCRANLITFLVAAPWTLTLTMVVLAFIPLPWGWLDGGSAHCFPHILHPHICLSHGTCLTAGQALNVVLLLGALAVAYGLSLAYRLRRSHRGIRLMLGMTQRRQDYHVIASKSPLALSVGLFRPKILVSTRLMESLSPEALTVVLAHERSHVQRRDALRCLLVECLLWVVPAKRMLLNDVTLACEEACDRAAVKAVGTPEQVAEALLAAQRLHMVTPAGQLGATGSHLGVRVHALLEESYPPWPFWTTLVWAIPLLPLGFEAAHRLVERCLLR